MAGLERISDEGLILAVESSCDDSSVAYIDAGSGAVYAERTINLSYFHKKFGGVVPEIAGREHLKAFTEIFSDGLEPEKLKNHIVALAATTSPGLIGSLLVGVTYAKSLAWLLGKPFIPIDHIEGHIVSAYIGEKEPEYPFVSLVVSGGHTLIALVTGAGEYELLGSTEDDAVGEAFDKVAKVLGLEYPGGPAVDILSQLDGITAHVLPTPLKGRRTLNFSLSGLKTAVLLATKSKGLYKPDVPLKSIEEFLKTSTPDVLKEAAAIAKGFQQTIAEILCQRIEETFRLTGCRTYCIAGGVSANSSLRSSASALANRLGIALKVPLLKHCSDNAAMIGYAARLYWLKDRLSFQSSGLSVVPSPGGIFTAMTPKYIKY